MNGNQMDQGDEELRRRFAELRDADRARTPGFDAVLESAKARGARRRSRIPLSLAAAAVLVLVTALALLMLHHRSKPEAFALSRWHSPTASLLRGPGAELLETVPRVSASLINLDALTERTNP